MSNTWDDERPTGGHRYAKTDEELSGYFTAALGVKAQSYQSSGGAFDSESLHAQRLRAIAGGKMAWFDAVGATLAMLPPGARVTLEMIYTPHSWPATWVASELATPWGGGSLATIALTLPRADGVRGWLLDVDRPAKQEWDRRKMLCSKLVNDAEALRMPAIVTYDALRVTRCKVEASARRERREDKAADSARFYAKLMVGADARAAARLERRMRRAA